MNTHFKKALDKIVVEEELLLKTKHLLDCARQTVPVKKVIPFKKILAIACTFIFVASVSFVGYGLYKTPVAYVSLDINPSVELGINSMNTVVIATSYNADGQQVLEGSIVLNTGVEQAIHALVESASQHGFISKDGSTVISVTSESDDKRLGETIQTSAEAGAKSALKKNHDLAAIYKENIPLVKHTEALSQGVSPGKLNLIHKVQTLDSSATVEKYKDAKVTEIMKKYVVLKKKKNAKPVKDPQKNHQDGQVSSPSPIPQDDVVVVDDPDEVVVDDGKIEDTVDEVNNNKDQVVKERHKAKNPKHTHHDSIDQDQHNNDSVDATPTPSPTPSPTPRPTPRPTPKPRPSDAPRNGPNPRHNAPSGNGNGEEGLPQNEPHP
ncbi:MAG: hypothetical protein WCL54_02870 [Clostridia bacterium]